MMQSDFFKKINGLEAKSKTKRSDEQKEYGGEHGECALGLVQANTQPTGDRQAQVLIECFENQNVI